MEKMIETLPILNNESEYQWNLPLLIFPDRISLLLETYWIHEEKWIELLDSFGESLKGIVIPLELRSETHWRQSLYGLDLLEWLRYSTDIKDAVNLSPVLAASWQPLQHVLKRKFEPLVVSYGCDFIRLPEAFTNNNGKLTEFVGKVRGKDALIYRETTENLRRLAFGRSEEAESLTHHDLANDYFAALRLWKGYLTALNEVSKIRIKNAELMNAVKELFKVSTQIKFSWQDDLERKIRRPYFRQFCLSHKNTGVATYPELESSSDIVRLHAIQGLPADSRILLVDDEFDKGLADSLLQILLGKRNTGKVDFTTKGPNDNEWIYSDLPERITRETSKKDRWARMVCVKDIYTAALWLKYWGEADLFNPRRKKSPFIEPLRSEESWVRDWGEFWIDEPKDINEIRDILGYNSTGKLNLDKDHARPKSVNTFVILDLRLKRKTLEEDEQMVEQDSKTFLRALKTQRTDIPVLMLTASRQANQYVNFMNEQDDETEHKADGWLIKEAPDAMTDDLNSSRAAQYLLDFIHLSGRINQWYRPAIGWTQDKRQEYHEMWSSSYFEECLKHITERANKYLENLKDEKCREKFQGRKLLGSVQQEGDNYKFDIEDRLVARRVVIWALLYSADWAKETPEWNVQKFLTTLSCLPVDTDMIYPSNVLNFNTDLYLGTYTPKLLEKLLKEEYVWLESQKWTDESRDKILTHLNRIRQKEQI